MSSSTSIEPADRSRRKGNVILIDRMCEKRVAERTKIFDRKCPGLYVSSEIDQKFGSTEPWLHSTLSKLAREREELVALSNHKFGTHLKHEWR